MKRPIATVAALLCALLAAGQAPAQQTTRLINTPAETFAMAPGGVDMRTGRYVHDETDLSIGGEGGLTLVRTMTQNIPGHGNPFGNLSHNWDITISEKIADPGQAGYRMFVNFGGRSQSFSQGAYPGFAPDSQGPLSSLTYTGVQTGASVVFTYTAADGSVALFRPLGTLGNGGCSHLRRCANIAQLTDPDGTVYTFDYAANGSGAAGGTERLRSVTSSRGYALLFEGTENRVTKSCVINLSLGALPATCPANAASASYTYTGATYVNDPSSPVIFGTYRLTGATGPDNATSSFTYDSGGSGMGFVRPGETSAWQTLTVAEGLDEQDVMQPIVSQQSFAGGLTYTYSYDMAPVTENRPHPSIAGGSYSYNDGQNRTVAMPYGFPLANVPGNPGYHCAPPSCQLDQPSDIEHWVYQQTPGPISITDQLGRTTSFNYCNPQGGACDVMPLVSFTDPEGATTDLRYDGRGNIDRVTRHPRPGSNQPNGQPWQNIVTSAVYDILHQRSQTKPLSMTDANGNTTNYTYAPEHGGVLTETRPAVNGIRPQTRHSYALRRAWISNGGGGYVQAPGSGTWLRTSTSTCRSSAATGSPCATAGDEVLTTFDYGPDSGPNTLLLRGQAVTATDNGVTTTLRTCYAYDPLGRRISETSPGANLASCPGTPPTAALPFTSSTRYDASNRVTGTISPDPDGAGALPHRAVRNSYDQAGRLIKVETGTLLTWQSEAVAPANWTGFAALSTAETQYDVMSHKTREFLREGAAGPVRTMTEYSYDVAGRVICTATRMNPAQFTLTGMPNACLPSTGGGDPDRIASTAYDAAGQRLQLREGVGTIDEGTEATWAYNLAGQVTNVIDGNGNRAALHYDGFGRQDCWIFPSTTRPGAFNDSTQASALASAGAVSGDCITTGNYERYGYDPNGNRRSLRKRDGTTIQYDYDALNRVTVKDLPATAWHNLDRSYGYDLLGHRVSVVGNGAIALNYDGFGRLTSETGSFGTVGYQYDSGGRRTRLTWPDGFYVAYDYLDTGEVTRIRENGATSGPGVLAAYTYDGFGRRARIDRGNGAATTYDYDGVSRLTGSGHSFIGGTGNVAWTYGRDPANGVRSMTRDNDAYAWAGHYAVARPYATNGLNQYSAAGPASFAYDPNGNLVSNGARSYEYNAENRLTVAYAGATHQELIDDSQDRLFRYYDGAANRWLIYDGTALIAEFNGSSAILRRYVHGPGTDEPLVWYEGSGTSQRRWLHADAQGSIVALSDASGAQTAINTYDEYGIPGTANQGRFQYTGQAWLPELGMYYYKARIYSPTLGRFMQTDPIGYDDQFNLYAYVSNDPINEADPTGEAGETITVTAQLCGQLCVRRGLAVLSIIARVHPAVRALNLISYAFQGGPFACPNRDGPACVRASSNEVDDTIADLEAQGTLTNSTPRVHNVNMGGGGTPQAELDFDRVASAAKEPIRTINTHFGPGRAVQLPGGGTASVRPGSSNGSPTVQISHRPGLPPKVVFRY